MSTFLNIAQIIVSLILIVVVLLTVRSNGFNQSTGMPTTKTKSERMIFYFLIAMAVLFAALSLTRLYFS